MSNPNPQLPATCPTCNGAGIGELKRAKFGIDNLCPTCHGTGKAPVCPTGCDNGYIYGMGRMASGMPAAKSMRPCPDEFHKAAEAPEPCGAGLCPRCKQMHDLEAPCSPPEATLAERETQQLYATLEKLLHDVDGGMSRANAMPKVKGHIEALIRSESQRAVEAIKHSVSHQLSVDSFGRIDRAEVIGLLDAALEDYRNGN
jgi:hypothetical protein